VTESGALFDRTKKYRYLLWRQWADGPAITFVMLNPSTADATKDDPTISRCISFAKNWGYGRLEVVNLFAYRATESKRLLSVRNPVGRENDDHIMESISRAQRILLAWGNCGQFFDRHAEVLELLFDEELFCLGMNLSGHPKHPLYVAQQARPVSYVRS